MRATQDGPRSQRHDQVDPEMRPSDEQDVRALCGTFYFIFDPLKILFKYHQVAMLFDIRFQLVAGGAPSTPATVPTDYGVQGSVVRHSDGWPYSNPDLRTYGRIEHRSSLIPTEIHELQSSSCDYERMKKLCIESPPCYDDSEPVVQTPSHHARPIVLKSKPVLFVPSCLFISLL